MELFWEKKGWEDADRHLLSLKDSPFQRPFAKLPKGPGLYVIRGPRQVGKSCWLKTILKTEDPKSVFFLSCENISDYKELSEIIKSVKDRKILLFDEISFVTQWWRAIKHKLDADSKVRIILTGSHAFDIRQGMDQMPGRWGNGGEYSLLPMDYFEFSQMRTQAGWAKPIDNQIELYFRIGGFPMSVIESGKNGTKPVKTMETYRRWLLGDFIKMGKQEQYLKEIMGQVAITTASTISLQKLAQRTQIGSHNTALDYIELLEAAFALKTLYSLDSNTGSPRFRKERKFYFRDPLLYWIALDWANQETPLNSSDQIAETVAHEHLLRKYKNFGFYSDRYGEIDFYCHKKWALEVKWKDIPTGLSKTYQKILIPKKMIWSKSNFLIEWP